jgi:energy-coupling factor transport system substrate-specific component
VLDLVSMWKHPKMIAFMVLTAVLYLASLYPLQGLTLFGGYTDFGRIGVAVPIAFSFLFGPAAAWGAAIGNILTDVAIRHVDVSSIFGFAGNLLLGYIPYKLWSTVTADEPDLRSLRKFSLFVGLAVLACVICGLVIGWGLYWLGLTSFMPTSAIIALTNALWATTVGSILLSLTYKFFSKRKLLYSNILNIKQSKANWNKTRSLSTIILIVSIACCFLVGGAFQVGPIGLLTLVVLSIGSLIIAIK